MSESSYKTWIGSKVYSPHYAMRKLQQICELCDQNQLPKSEMEEGLNGAGWGGVTEFSSMC